MSRKTVKNDRPECQYVHSALGVVNPEPRFVLREAFPTRLSVLRVAHRRIQSFNVLCSTVK